MARPVADAEEAEVTRAERRAAGPRPAISYSKILLFKKCPRMYWHKYVDRSEERETAWPGGLFGVACHAGLEDVVRALAAGGSRKDAEGAVYGRFRELFERARDEAGDAFRESREFRMDRDGFIADGDRALLSVARFFSAYFAADRLEWREMDSEREYRAQWREGVDCVGIIDVRITLADGSQTVVDLKVTGDGSTYWWMDWDNDAQSLMYDMLLDRATGSPASQFAYMVYDRSLRTLFVKERPLAWRAGPADHSVIGAKIDELRRFDAAASDALALELARPSEQSCKWCPWAKGCGRRWRPPGVEAVRRAMGRR